MALKGEVVHPISYRSNNVNRLKSSACSDPITLSPKG